MRRSLLSIGFSVGMLLAPVVPAHQDDHSHGETQAFGEVHFPTSCRDVDTEFTLAVALLHSFGYEEARRAFEAVAAKDPACAMAYWGIAMTWYHPIWAPPNAQELAAGVGAANKAAELATTSERERGFIDAIGVFYRDAPARGHQARAQAYSDAMARLATQMPGDHEIQIFYALSLLGTAPPGDASFAHQKQAAAILNGLLPLEPRHPGIAHYMIHSFDYPQLAADAGRRLVAIRHPGAASMDTLHALDYLEYSYLQIGDDAAARQILPETAAAKTFDDPTFAAGYAVAAIPARFALERHDWKAAAVLEPSSAALPWPNFPYATAIAYFARAIGAARSGDLDSARAALLQMETVRAGLQKSPIAGPYDWTRQVEAAQLAATAWLRYAEGRNEAAVQLAQTAAQLEDANGKHPVTPGPPLPARELLGDLLLAMDRPAEALAAYDASLAEAPDRFNSIYGAARAAELSQNVDRARELYAALVAQCVADSPRTELVYARQFLGSSSTR